MARTACNKPKIEEGYRLLEVREILEEVDEVFVCGWNTRWSKTTHVGKEVGKAPCNCWYRRKEDVIEYEFDFC